MNYAKSPSHRIIQLYETSTTNDPINPKRLHKHKTLCKHLTFNEAQSNCTLNC